MHNLTANLTATKLQHKSLNICYKITLNPNVIKLISGLGTVPVQEKDLASTTRGLHVATVTVIQCD